MLGSPHRDAVLQVGSHKTALEGLAHVPVPADLGSFPCSPAHGCFLGWQHRVLAHIQLLLHGHPKCFSSAPAPLGCLCPAKPLLRAAPAALCVIGKAIPEPWAQAEPSLRDTLIPGLHPAMEPLTTTPWLCPSGQFLWPRTAQPAQPGLGTVGLGVSVLGHWGSQGSGHSSGVRH